MKNIYTSTRARYRKKLRQKKPVKVWMPIIVVVLTFFAMLAYLCWQYTKQPFHIKNADTLVVNRIAEVIETDHKDSYHLTRLEVLQILSNVFLDLKQDGFRETKNTNDVIRQALELEILAGDNNGDYRPGSLATKEDSLAFIARALGIPEERGEENEQISLDRDKFSDWAGTQLEGLVLQDYFTVNEINELGDLREAVTALELEKLLDQVVEAKTQYINFWEFICSWVQVNVVYSIFLFVLSALSSVASVLAVMSFIGALLKTKKTKDLRRGTICLAGCTGVGKTTLKTRMQRPEALSYDLEHYMTPTRTLHKEDVVLQGRNGDIVFEGDIFDVPGSKTQYVINTLLQPCKNKILLLVLAHTKSNEEKENDQDLIQEQLLKIEHTWAPMIEGFVEKPKKIVIFINKKDLISQEYRPVQKHIYEKHIELLSKAAKNANIPISAVEGSSTTGENLDVLYERLNPGSI